MSLINKMLQDLDARGPQAGAPLFADVKSVARGGDGVSTGVAAAAIVVAVLVGAAGVYGWRVWKRPAAPVVLTQPATVVPTVALTPRPVIAPPALAAAPVVVAPQAPAAPSAVASPQAPAAPQTVTAPQAVMAPHAATVAARAPAPVAPQSTRSTRAKTAPAISAAAKRKAKHDEQKKLAANKKHAQPAVRRAAPAAPAKPSPSGGTDASAQSGGRDMSAGQRAESAYRDAIASLQDGRIAKAITELEQALKFDARHDAARQTLVGLLVEAKRPDDAIRLLQTGLTLEPRQPGMAMLLARLQIERGGNGIDTLMRSLPYASGNGDYHAFLAGALQRQARHHEAAEQYQAALQIAPQQGVWWMGLGISLQADKRNAEALAAFQRARDSGMLSPELQAFVERRLQQLTR